MKVYLVGGAVRDELLGIPVKEKDWVVVGATHEEMQNKGFQRVGKDFPVFLHPESGEEYALARTERKSSPGYYGFVCDFNPATSLEDDLARRDLTINAMAKTTTGEFIDPYGGQQDLKNKLLRHVSPAFVEDPVRVLRVARFAARYHHLGFSLAPETRRLMYAMVKNGELNHLVAERVWQEWYKSLTEKNPEIFVTTLRACGALQVILPELDILFGIPNTKRYHPEVDSGIHTLMTMESAAKISDDIMVRFAASVHDLGKAKTSMNIWPAQYGHDKRGQAVIKMMCERLRVPTDYRKFAEMVSLHHLNIHRVSELNPKTIVQILEMADAFRRPHLFEKLLVVCSADHMGKGKNDTDYPQANNWLNILRETSKINVRLLIEKGLKGEEIKNELHQLRVECVRVLLKR